VGFGIFPYPVIALQDKVRETRRSYSYLGWLAGRVISGISFVPNPRNAPRRISVDHLHNRGFLHTCTGPNHWQLCAAVDKQGINGKKRWDRAIPL